jgi:coenzyme F420-dependent glucose-6-phosphate dehydrogenase
MTRYFIGLSQEQFAPEELLRQAVAAEQAGFDGISSSDHLQPWWEGGESGHTWPWLGGHVGRSGETRSSRKVRGR